MNTEAAEVPSLTPPKKEKKVRKAKDPSAEKKSRQPRADYGFSPDSVIRIVENKENKYRGNRKVWFESLVIYKDQKVADWADAVKDRKEPPRGWLRFFIQDGAVTLEKPPVATSGVNA